MKNKKYIQHYGGEEKKAVVSSFGPASIIDRTAFFFENSSSYQQQ